LNIVIKYCLFGSW